MKLINITKNDFDIILKFTKNYFNFDFYLTQPNNEFVNNLVTFNLNMLLNNATHGSFLTSNQNDLLGLIIYQIPKREPLFNKNLIDNNKTIFNNINSLSEIEKIVLKKELDLWRATNFMFNKYHNLFVNKAEIKIIYIDIKFQKRDITKSLWHKLFDELTNYHLDSFYFFTNSTFDYLYFEKINLQKIKVDVYDKDNCPFYLQYKIKLPLSVFAFLGSIKTISL